MNRQGKKLLVLDIDGTLVNNEKKITPKTREALIRANEAGHCVMLASGRPTPGVERFVKELRLEELGGLTMTFNGARVQDCRTGKDLYEKKLSPEILPVVYDFAEKYDLGIVTFEQDLTKEPQSLSGRRLDDWIRWEARINGLVTGYVENFLDYVNFDIYKILLSADPEKSEGYMKELQEILGDRANVLRSEPFFVEVMACGIDKAATLETVLPSLGFRREDTICCGDAFNDISMVRFAGIGVAMGNAVEEVKQAADYITASNEEDGIAQVVERFLDDNSEKL